MEGHSSDTSTTDDNLESQPPKQSICGICKKVFSFPSVLSCHMKSKHSNIKLLLNQCCTHTYFHTVELLWAPKK